MVNVGGLRSKLKSEDFFDFINEYDIVSLTEIKMDTIDVDSIKPQFENFDIFCNIEKDYSVKPRGGIMVLFKKKLLPYIHIFPSEQNLALFFQIKAEVLASSKDLICGCTYIPPCTSLYYDKNCFEILEAELIELKGLEQSDLIIFGDINAKTNTEKDYITFDKHDKFAEPDDVCSKICTPTRANKDTHDLDLQGKKLIDFCKTLKLRIVNGRIGADKGIGQFTTRNGSVVDYLLAPAHYFSHFSTFQVHDFDPLISDVHCPLTFEIKAKSIDDSKDAPEQSTTPISKWDPKQTNKYIENFQQLNLLYIKNKLENLSLEPSSTKINDLIFDINKIFQQTKLKTFPPKVRRFIKKKPWYDIILDKAKKNFSAARKRKNKTVTSYHGRFYKKLLNSKFKSHGKKTASKLRSSQTQDPKKFWKILNQATNQKNHCKISPEEFEQHFKDLNVQDIEENEIETQEEHIICFDLLNATIDETELKKGLKSLKNNKSTGPDGILNEQIKATFPMMKHIYLKLFNVIFDTGCFPETWAQGMIVPIYKKKGNKNDPNNYRGITLISCLAKFFTIILNNRLKVVAKWVITNIQAGFQQGYSTLDHVFTLMCIMLLYKKYKKNLFIAFIDYQKAFDTIWRAGLWSKLMREGIGGKFLNVIKDMYNKSKSCVLQNGKMSGYFSSFAGVRQGEILSPLLFAFYINDLENFLKSKNITSLSTLKDISHDVSNLLETDLQLYLELLTLFYADDTILMSETASGLQQALDELLIYCKNWKLAVNQDKTKIICILNEKKSKISNLNFFYDGKKLEIVDEFIYLGVKLTQRGITNETVNTRIAPAQRTMFSTLSKSKAIQLPIDLTLELFEKTVAPCALYGSEIFGFNNCTKLETLQLKYLKYALKLKTSTSTNIIYGETGFFPIEILIKIRMVTFWVSLITGSRSKISFKMYVICAKLHSEGIIKFSWLQKIIAIIYECGMGYVYQNQAEMDPVFLKNQFLANIKTILREQFIQKWEQEVAESSKCFYYRHFQLKPQLQNYLRKSQPEVWIPIVKLRTANHKFPIEIYSWSVLYREKSKRLCSLCTLNEIGDEYHYIMICPIFSEARKYFLPKYFHKKPSVYKYIELVNSVSSKTLSGLSKLLNILFSFFK